jgi:hypothetical protein
MMRQGVSGVWTQLFLALALYGAITLVWQWTAWSSRRRAPARVMHFVIVTENAERDIEGVLRHLLQKCRRLEYASQISIIDANSQDLTVPIIERLAKDHLNLALFNVSSYMEATEMAQAIQSADDQLCAIYEVRSRGDVKKFSRHLI